MVDELFLPPSSLLPVFRKHFPIRPVENLPDSLSTLEIHLLDLSSIPLRLRSPVPFVYSQRLVKARVDPVTFDDVYDDVLRFKEGDGIRRQHPILLFAVGGNVTQIRNDKSEILARHSVVLLGAEDVDRLAKGTRSEQVVDALGVFLRRDLPLKILHPYQPRNPAVAGAFFGRAELLRDLTVGQQTASAVVLGNRRMGKTSLMLELQRRLERSGIVTAFVSGLNRYTPELAAPYIAQELFGLSQRSMSVQMNELPERIAKAAEHTGKQYAIFYDEVDKLIEHDDRNGWPVLGPLKVIKDQYSVYCRVFLAGFRDVMAKFNDHRDPNNPLANFGISVRVRRLESPERKLMIERPLRLLGLEPPSDLYNVIDKATVGMPELIQICCRGLVGWFEMHGALPSADIFSEWIFSEDDYRDAVRYTFIRNTTPFERLIILLLIDDAREHNERLESYSFEVDKVLAVLRHRDGRVPPAILLEDAMGALSTASIIEKASRANEYKFTLPSLGRFYASNASIQAAIESAKDEMRAQTDGWIWHEPTEDEPEVVAPEQR